MAELIPDATLDEWWDNCDFTRPEEDVQRLIAAYRESRAMQAQHLEHAQILWEEKGAWEARARKAEADLAALRVGIEALVTEWDQPHYHRAVAGNLMRSLRALLSTSTDQPEGEPACGNPDCTMHHHGEA